MSLKSITCAAVLFALMTTPVLAAPSLSWVDNLDGTLTLQIHPTGVGSIEAEISFTSEFDLTSAILADAVTFDTANPGNNPITGTVTNGLWLDLANDQLFASFGSIVLDSTAAVDFLTVGYGGFSGGSLLAAGLVAEGGTTFLGLTASVGIAVDGNFSDLNGDGIVDLLDLDILGSNFGDSPATRDQGDINGDNIVDLLDLDILGTNFGNTGFASATAIPEPTSWVMLLSCMAGLVSRRKP